METNKNLDNIEHMHLSEITEEQKVAENINMQLFLKYEKEVSAMLLKDFPSRYWHSISVAISAVHFADIYGVNKDSALIAGLLHDICKCIKPDQLVPMCKKEGLELTIEDENSISCIHGFLAAKICKNKYNINDEIYNAIYYHTCGRPNMTMLEKILYVTDFIEPIRKSRDKMSDIRIQAFKNIDSVISPMAAHTIKYVMDHNEYVHSNTIAVFEYYKKYAFKEYSIDFYYKSL